MTWGAQYMCYVCEKCGKKYRYAIDLIGDYGADFGKCPVSQTLFVLAFLQKKELKCSLRIGNL